MSETSHFHIAKAARRCVGVDIVAGEVERRRNAGYDVRLANVETMQLGETFDVIVAADLIEHVSNAGAFLDRAREHLHTKGLLCVVTPNLWSANVVLKSLAGIQSQVNPEHTCWYDPVTLRQLLERHGFEPEEWYWQDYQMHPLAALLTHLRPNLAAHFIVIARRKE
jgi:cyclopropane fatty-acyl-phospholipid synthase-like methyltransferase